MSARCFGVRVAVLVCGAAWAGAACAQMPAPAQDTKNPNFFSNVHRDLVQEGVNFSGCRAPGLQGISNCGETLFTGTPFHVAVGSLAPQNGVAAGLAFAEVYHPTYCSPGIDFTKPPAAGVRNACHWSLNFNADGEASGNGSWRAGLYVTAVRLSARTPRRHYPGQPRPRHAAPDFSGPSATVDFYSESSSLNRIYFYGLGPNTVPQTRTDFGLFENITGFDAIIPVHPFWLGNAGVSLVGEVNGRFPSVRGSYGDTSPSIETTYSEATAPGLSSQPKYFQAGEGVRLVPEIPRGLLHLNYLVNFQQLVAPSETRYSFRRFTTDLDHRFVLYTKDVGKPPRPPLPHAPNTPDVPPISTTRDVTGALSARLFIQESIANAGHIVPFYLSPTIGGSDINGQAILPSYPDYRFRAPNVLLINGSYEQSLGKIPIGLFVGIDEAKVALRRDDIAFNHLRHSYSAGLTVHAGGLPVFYLLFAWGGPEGHHVIANISNELLGGTTRPSLF